LSESKRIIIVGGVAGGASAAARARRLSEDATIIMFERGPYISFANCGLPYHIGGTITKRDSLLVQTPQSMKERFRIDVRTNSEVVKIDRTDRRVTVKDLITGEIYQEPYDVLILSPGAAPVRPPIEGVESSRVLTLRNMGEMDTIIQMIQGQPSASAVIVGGGFIGLEMAETLRQRDLSVTLIELMDQVMPPVDAEMASTLHAEMRRHGVDLRLQTAVEGFSERPEGLEVLLSSGDRVLCTLAILAIGVRPEIRIAAEAGLKIGALKGILVDEHLRTSDPNIYAVGDVIEVQDFVSESPMLVPLAGPANRQGRIAADNIVGRNSIYKKTQGTAICKVFDLTIALTGMSEKSLKRENIPYEKIYLHPADHATYYPDANVISLKMLFDPKDGKILGAQAVGKTGVDERIDVLAMAIRCGLSCFDLEEAELCYAPPYGSAKDPINQAGFIASNVVRGDLMICHVQELQIPKEDQVILDVRTAIEVKQGMIPGSIHIPVNDLREHLHELPKDKEILINCQVGQRSYIAYRILHQKGYRSRVISGGYTTYQMVKGA